jgi:hypothetical protein
MLKLKVANLQSASSRDRRVKDASPVDPDTAWTVEIANDQHSVFEGKLAVPGGEAGVGDAPVRRGVATDANHPPGRQQEFARG